MDVLFASELLAPWRGGAERTVREWVDGLRERGHTARTVALEPQRRPAAERYWRWRAAQRAQLRERVACEIATRRPDVVVAQLHGAPGALHAAAQAGIPGALVFASYEGLCKIAHDPGSDCPPGGDCVACPHASRLPAAERAALRESRAAHDAAIAGAAVLFAHSAAIAATARAWTGREAQVVHCVAPPLPPAAGARHDGPVACVAANWSSVKGSHLLGRLVAAALAGGAPEVRVTEVGLNGAERDEVVRAGATLRTAAPIDDLLRGCSLLLVPSQWDEPFGRVAWEALARGVPVLASAAGGLVEYVPPDLLVAPRDDASAWEAAITRLLGSGTAWAQAAHGARAHAAALLRPPPIEHLESGLLAAIRG
jgi:glycosyltransferase involved in cell wall biosynthesis